MLTPSEYKVLKRISEHQVVTRGELLNIFDRENCKTIVDTVVKSLSEKGYITTASPVGSKCFIITKGGLQALENYE
ncbi:MAG: hypothetical protein J7J38_01305 [Candidatus Aenigmarchaeota archaeon]|nr:hypothetical protein [Candidatus Aenigmarchaeota archaeon]